jgi:phosphoribosyl-AMP cyclohydrolase
MTGLAIEETGELKLRFDASGLITAVVQDASSREVLMVAWMNAEAFALTRSTGFAHFYSRSRQRLWKKGEESGNTLLVREIRVDCDQDTLLLVVELQGAGVACHTGRRGCFYRQLADGGGLVLVQGLPAAARS